jgi:hypothetical protein
LLLTGPLSLRSLRLLIHQVVSLLNIGSVILNFGLLVLPQFSGVTVHYFVPSLSNRLSSLIVAFFSKLRGLLNSIDTENLEICIFLELILVGRNLQELSNNSNLFRTVKSSVVELSLERYFFQG